MRPGLLGKVPLFGALPSRELEWLAEQLAEVEFESGSLLLREGDAGNNFFVIAQGEIEIVRGLETRNPEVLAVRGAGEIVGEFALLSDEARRTASVRAVSDVRALEIDRPLFDELLQRNPLLAYSMVGHLATRLHEAHRHALQDLLAAQEEVIQKRSMERELELARKIQMRMIPPAVPSVPGFDFGARLVPMTQVGGDFYDFLRLADGRIGVVVGDVSGHGVPAALIMSVTMALIRLEAERSSSPAEVLRHVNRQLTRFSSGESFVTVLYAILAPLDGRLVYCRAGHEPPVLAGDGASIALEDRSGPLLGLMPEITCADFAVDLAPGADVVFYTDGVTEARDSAGGFFRIEGLLRVVAGSSALSAQDVCDAILAAVEKHALGSLPQDDITVVCVKAAPA